MKRRSTVIAALAAAASLTGAAAAWAQTPAPIQRIGFVDVQRVLARSAAGVAAREQLEREKASMQKEMDGRKQEIEKLRDEIEKKGPLMTADARREKEEAFERKRRDASRLVDDFQRELAKKEQLLARRVLQEVTTVVERVAREKGYQLVLERQNSGIVFVATEADLTEEIIRAYDRDAASKGKK